VSGFSQLWKKLVKSKKYREEFVAAQVKRGIPFQIRTLLKQTGLSQEKLASQAGLTQGVVSRAADPNYGNLTLNTIIRIAAGFDVAFVGKFVPFSELGKWFIDLSEESVHVKTFEEENAAAGPQADFAAAGPVIKLAELTRGLPAGLSSQDFLPGREERVFIPEGFAFALSGQPCGQQVPLAVVPNASGASIEKTIKLSSAIDSGRRPFLVHESATFAENLRVKHRRRSRKERSKRMPIERDYGRRNDYTPAVAI
jgi:transcriptional regulator with XRE-family HTH domain